MAGFWNTIQNGLDGLAGVTGGIEEVTDPLVGIAENYRDVRNAIEEPDQEEARFELDLQLDELRAVRGDNRLTYALAAAAFVAVIYLGMRTPQR